MLTTCPSCHTTFKVTREQLEAHHGDVRCGRCSTIFNGNTYLASEPHTVLTQPTPDSAPASSRTWGEPDVSSVEPPNAPELEPSPLPDAEQNPVPLAPPAGIVAPPLKFRTGLFNESMAAPDATPAGPQSSRKKILYGVGSAFLLLLLALQAAYFFRDAIAARFVGTRPALNVLCQALGCTVGLPREPDKIVIESSDLQAGTQPGVMIFSAILRSKASHPIAYPMLDLALTDTEDAALARRILPPTQYLRKVNAVKDGIPPHGEVALRLTLNIGNLKAAGYRVYAFYPER